MSSHTMIVTCVRWGGEGLIYSSSRDCCINVWSADEGKLVRTLKGHAHWVNTMALSTESVLRSGAFDHTGKAPADQQEAKKVRRQLLSKNVAASFVAMCHTMAAVPAAAVPAACCMLGQHCAQYSLLL
jgi:ribosome assembly protein 4